MDPIATVRAEAAARLTDRQPTLQLSTRDRRSSPQGRVPLTLSLRPEDTLRASRPLSVADISPPPAQPSRSHRRHTARRSLDRATSGGVGGGVGGGVKAAEEAGTEGGQVARLRRKLRQERLERDSMQFELQQVRGSGGTWLFSFRFVCRARVFMSAYWMEIISDRFLTAITLPGSA